ncbi:uncharacterized protein TM35_001141080 [Trypanosoma theileri]|uniref:Titin n=1 Tax=Trypanosoma theileri TaxID=67003 RepID=A0A1X0NFN2_9TRYP|nr:uncharacterized protein TM35_001141080 [Trypanosoma theileri]ORC81513.1 hypothetical protein TM35_001141080 [Trypanosoma theileri]
MMRYVLCILALLLSCACVHVLAEEVPAADLSDQVPDTESETKILLPCLAGSEPTAEKPCVRAPPDDNNGLKVNQEKKQCETHGKEGEKQNCETQAQDQHIGEDDDEEEEEEVVQEEEDPNNTTPQTIKDKESGGAPAEPGTPSKDQIEVTSPQQVDGQVLKGPKGDSSKPGGSEVPSPSGEAPSGPTAIDGQRENSDKAAGGIPPNVESAGEQPSSTRTETESATGTVTSTANGATTAASESAKEPDSTASDEESTNNTTPTITTTTTTTLPPGLTNNKKSDADSSSSISSSVWVRVPLLIVVTLSCIVVC